LLPSIGLIGARAEPCPPDEGHDDSPFQQVIAAYHENKRVEGPRMACERIQERNDGRIERVHEYLGV
jgi:hypothetical protein